MKHHLNPPLYKHFDWITKAIESKTIHAEKRRTNENKENSKIVIYSWSSTNVIQKNKRKEKQNVAKNTWNAHKCIDIHFNSYLRNAVNNEFPILRFFVVVLLFVRSFSSNCSWLSFMLIEIQHRICNTCGLCNCEWKIFVYMCICFNLLLH